MVGISIRTPLEAAKAAESIRTRDREHVLALYLNTQNQLIYRELIAIGILNACLIHPREVFAPAILHRAAGVIVLHNHPSGVATPSDEDLAITRRLTEAGKLIGIELLDHVIVTEKTHFSLKENECF